MIPVPGLRHPGWPWFVVAAATLVQCLGVPPAVAAARGFMAATVGIAAIGATKGMPRASRAVTALLLAGSVGIAFGTGSFDDPPSTLWGEVLEAPGARARHEIALPRADRRWEAATRADAAAFLYVCARGRLEAPDTLDVSLNGEPLTALDPSMMFGPRPDPESVGFYRVPVPWPRLDAVDRIVVGLSRQPGTTRPPEVCGTFMARPTARLDASEVFDGTSWTSPWTTRRGRLQIELRLEGPDGHVYGAWY